MSKSPGSVASSDEAQSVSDESLAMSAATSHTSLRSVGVVKAVKKAKEEAKERPPWRPASITQSVAPVPPPPKPDLKARLLEASKRMRRVNAAVQTDPVHTKLMKEASNDEQTDLIVMVDEEILTDGNLALARDTGNLILTHSVAQMTDHAVRRDTGTQTAMPRSAVSFRKFLEPMEPQESTNVAQPEPGAGDDMVAKIDEKIKRLLSPVEPTQEDASSSASDSIKEPNTPDLISATVDGDPSPHKPFFLDTPTFAAWQNLDFSDEESDGYMARELPRRTIGEGDRPWADFKDLVIGKRVFNMRLSPIPLRRRRPNKKTVTWSDEQHRAVSNLLTEASALVDMFDQVSMLLGPDIQLPNLPATEEEFKLPPAKWEPLLSKSCDLLEEKLAQVRHLSQENLDNILMNLEPSRLDGGEA